MTLVTDRIRRCAAAAALAAGLTAGPAAPLAGQTFTDVGAASETQVLCNTHGTGFFDTDGDGWDDVYVIHNLSQGQTDTPNTLLRNNGNGTFADESSVSETRGYPQSSAQGLAAGDFDNDGDTDMAVGMGKYNKVLFYENRGDGTFADVDRVYDGHGMTFRARNLAFIDVDNDGYLDLFFTRDTYLDNPGYNPRFLLFQNNRRGGFNDVTAAAGLWNFVPKGENKYGFAAADVDNDGDVDLYATGFDSPSLFLANNGNGTFTETAAGRGLPNDSLCLGAAFLDYNNDGWWDLFLKREHVGDKGWVYGRLFRNDGDGTFTEATSETDTDVNLGWHHEDTVFGGGLTAADFDNDGWTDLLSINEWGGNCTLLRNWGNGKFLNMAGRAGLVENAYRWYWSAPVADYNHDGYLDIYMGRSLNPATPTQFASLYRNNGGSLNWIQCRLAGVQSNRSGVGARLEVFTGGRRQMRQVTGGEGYKVNSFTVHFGLGNAGRVDSLIVHWPSGAVQKIMGIPAGQFYAVRETEGTQYFGDLAVTGTIRTAGTGRSIGGVTVQRDGSAVSVPTDATGAYRYAPILYAEPSLVLRPAKAKGESVGDGVLTAYDAALVLRHAAGSPIPSALQPAADADGNGTINALDASAIAKTAAGLSSAADTRVSEWRFAPATRSYANVLQSVAAQDYAATLAGDASGNWGADPAAAAAGGIVPDAVAVYRNTGSFGVVLNVPSLQNAFSSDIRLEYDPSVLQFVQADKSGPIADFSMLVNAETAGRLGIALYGTRAMTPGSAFLTLTFRLLRFPAEPAALDWKKLAFNEVSYGSARTAVNGVDLTVSGTVLTADALRGVPGVVIGGGGLLSSDPRTDASGFYRTPWIPYGTAALVLRPSKPRWEDVPAGSIDAYDAACILRHAAGSAVLSAALQAAADVNGDGRVDTTDAEAVALFSAGRPAAATRAGEWRFAPESLAVPAVTHSFTDRNFEAAVVGDAGGDGWRRPDTTDAPGAFPDSIVAERNRGTVAVPVRAGGFADVSAVNLDFTYDPAALSFENVRRSSSGNGVRVRALETEKGRVSVVLWSADPVSASDDLFSLTFRMLRYPIPPTGVAWTSLSLNGSPCRGGRTVVYGLDLSIRGHARYAGTGDPVPAATIRAGGPWADSVRTDAEGYYVLAPLPYGASDLEVRPSKPRWEDVGPAAVTALDASDVLRHLSGSPLPAERAAAADADGDGRVDASDAAVIAGRAVQSPGPGLLPLGAWKFIPDGRIYPELVRSFDSEDFTAVIVGDASGNWNRRPDSLSVRSLFPDTLTAADTTGFVEAGLGPPADVPFRSADLEVRYDTAAVSFVEIRKADAADPLVLAFHEPEKGRVRAALYAGTASGRTGPWLRFRFEPRSGDVERFDLSWTELAFDDRPAAGGITAVRISRPDTASHDTTSHDTTDGFAGRDGKPRSFGLAGAYPNPFNPEVTVAVRLDRTEDVSIRVTDVYGRDAAVLFEGRKSAGEYRMIWNGRDRSGMDAPSGLYFVRLCAAERRSIVKILKIK
jgi:enediyne biosynthesis protein E4